MNSNHLKAIAGWALMKRCEDSAYGRLADSAGEVAELESQRMVNVAHVPHENPAPKDTPAEVREEAPTQQPYYDAAFLPPERVDSCQNGTHRFDIVSQRCVGCGETYRSIRSRKPELM